MASVLLDFTIFRKGRKHDDMVVSADPADPAALQAILEHYLAGEAWDEALWPQFTAEVREAGKWKLLHRVRVV